MTLAVDLPLAVALVASLGVNARQVMVASTRNARPKPQNGPPPPAKAFDPSSGHVLTIAPTGAPEYAGVPAVVTSRDNPEVSAP